MPNINVTYAIQSFNSQSIHSTVQVSSRIKLLHYIIDMTQYVCMKLQDDRVEKNDIEKGTTNCYLNICIQYYNETKMLVELFRTIKA